jgi:hypothetical protein
MHYGKKSFEIRNATGRSDIECNQTLRKIAMWKAGMNR